MLSIEQLNSLDALKLAKAYKRAKEHWLTLTALRDLERQEPSELQRIPCRHNRRFCNSCFGCDLHRLDGCNRCTGNEMNELAIRKAAKKLRSITFLFRQLDLRERYGVENVESVLMDERLADAILREEEKHNSGMDTPIVDRTDLYLSWEDVASNERHKQRRENYLDDQIDKALPYLPEGFELNREEFQETLQEMRKQYYKSLENTPEKYEARLAKRMGHKFTQGDGSPERRNVEHKRREFKLKMEQNLAELQHKLESVRVTKK